MNDFWRNCGFHLLERRTDGRLVPTDAFLRAYLVRAELRPAVGACTSERALHAGLLDQPRRAVADAEIAALADADARDNWHAFLAYRARLLAHPTLEHCYLDIVANDNRDVAPLFVDQLAHVIVRNMLDGCTDPLQLRVAELFYRPQQASFSDGQVMLADADTVSLHAEGHSLGAVGRLLVEGGLRPRTVALDVITPENAHLYWLRDQAHDTAIALSHGQPALAALCRVLERWVVHLLGSAVRIAPLREIRDERWRWHIGLDRTAMALLNDLYRGAEVAPERLARLVALMRLDFADAREQAAELRGCPVYLALAADESGRVAMKPQNLLLNLPRAQPT